MLDLYVNIRKRRKELGMSQDELAKKVGYTSRSTVARVENGEIDLPRSKIFAFAEALKTTPGELMGLDGTMEAEWIEDVCSQMHGDLIIKLTADPDLMALVEKANADDDFRNRLLQIAKLLEK